MEGVHIRKAALKRRGGEEGEWLMFRYTYKPGGEDLTAEENAPPRGLRLPRCANEPDAFPDAVRWAFGEGAFTAATAAAAADSSAVDAVVFEADLAPLEEPLLKDDLSWGAGDGAMVMTALIMKARFVLYEASSKLQK